MTTNNLDLVKTLLVACDQSYSTDPMALQGTALEPLPDRNKSVVEYRDQRIYKDTPDFAWDSAYIITKPIDLPAIGAKALVYLHPTTRNVIVAFAGTDGTSLQDWVANTQSLGWSQWLKWTRKSRQESGVFKLGT